MHQTYEAVIKFKPETINRYNGKLHVLFIWAIRRQFENRSKVKYHKDGSTSDLNEFASVEVADIPMDISFESEFKEELLMVQMAIDKAMLTQNNGSKEDSDFMKVSTFLQAVDRPVLEISRSTGIPRYYVSNLVKQGQQHLKQAIQE